MEFSEKLQQLRKQRNLTQEQLASAIFVSRTAVSKWESGRGVPEIGSLKSLAAFFDVTVDDLLSPSEALEIGVREGQGSRERIVDLTYGLLDICTVMLVFLPLFRGSASGQVVALSLLALVGVASWLRIVYAALVAVSMAWGILTLALQTVKAPFWQCTKYKLSLALSIVAVLLFVLSMQPYATVLAFFLLTVKVVILQKKL